MTRKIIPVILCGGAGSRLWPLSRVDAPKQFLRLLDDRSLLQRTALRALAVSGAAEQDLVVVTLESLRDETVSHLSEISTLLARHVLCEPRARNTAAAMAYAAQYVADTFGGDALLWVLPSDHHVGDEKELARALGSAVLAAEEGRLVTFGIAPTRAETGYGYIMTDGKADANGICGVARFVEKPPLDMAEAFVRSGKYLWSSGMHLFRAATAAENFLRHSPALWEAVARARAADPAFFAKIYAAVEEMPFEHAVLEKAEGIAVVPCDPQWSDIGNWESLWEINPKNADGNAFRGRVVCEKTEDSMILSQGKLITCVGLSNVVIIETEDSILVADKQNSGSLKELVKALQAAGHKEIMSPVVAAALATPSAVAAS